MKGLDTQGWQIQLASVEWPRMNKKRPVKNWHRKLMLKLDSKSIAIERIYEDPVLFEKYPKGRLKHLIRQMDRFEYYLGLAQIGVEHGGVAR